MKALPLLLKRLSVSLFPAIIIPSAFAGLEMQARWSKSYGTPLAPGASGEGTCSLLAAPDGDTVTIGTAAGKISVWRHNSFGGLVWSSQEPGAGAKGIFDSSGHICVAGILNGDIVVKKLSPSGEVLWRRVWDAPPDKPGTVADLITDADGSIYVAGSLGNGSSQGVLLLKYDGGGSLRWSQRYEDTEAPSSALRVVLTPDANVTVCGTIGEPATTGQTGQRDFLFLRYSPDSTFRWKKTWANPEDADDVLTHVAVDAAGNLTVAGNSARTTMEEDVAVVRMDADATVLWEELIFYRGVTGVDPFPGLDVNRCCGLSLTPDGKAAVSVDTMRFTFGNAYNEFGTVAFLGADGHKEWHTEIRKESLGYTHREERIIGPVICQPDGSCLIGASFPRGVTHLNPGGSINWNAVPSPGPSLDAGPCRAMLMDGSSRLYQCFASFNSTSGSSGAVTLQKWTDWSEPAIPPVVQTAPPLEIAYNIAKVSGTIEARPLDTFWWFEYGPTLPYSGLTPGSTLPAGGEAMPVDAFIPGLSPNTVYYCRLAATCDGSTIAYGAPVEFTTPPSPLQFWTMEKFGALNTPGALPEDDPDQDGLLNLTEFAFGGNPLHPDKPSALPQPELYVDPETGNKYLAITYTVNPAAVDLAYTPETAPDPASFNITGVSIQELPGNRRRAVATAGGRFMRVRVTLGP